MAHAPEILVLISRAGIDIYTNSGKVPREGLGRDAYSIRKSRYLIKFSRVLESG